MTLSGPRKHCSRCGKPMRRHGTTTTGRVRFRCVSCRSTSTRNRKDNRRRTRLSLFVAWLTSKKSLVDVGHERGVSVQTLLTWFTPLWDAQPKPRISTSTRILVVDGTSVKKRERILLIASNADTSKPVSWMDCPRECYDAWVIMVWEI